MDRTHKENIERLKQEMTVIVNTLEAQHRIFELILQHNSLGGRPDDYYRTNRIVVYNDATSAQHDPKVNAEARLSATSASGFRELLAQACSEIVRNRLQRFRELEGNALDLQRRVRLSSPSATVLRKCIANLGARTSSSSTRTRTTRSPPCSSSPS